MSLLSVIAIAQSAALRLAPYSLSTQAPPTSFSLAVYYSGGQGRIPPFLYALVKVHNYHHDAYLLTTLPSAYMLHGKYI